MTDQFGLPRYDVLVGAGVGTLNALLDLHAGNQPNATITLRDPESGEKLHVTLVAPVQIEHDSVEGVLLFSAKLTISGASITGHVRFAADGTSKVGEANIKFI